MNLEKRVLGVCGFLCQYVCVMIGTSTYPLYAPIGKSFKCVKKAVTVRVPRGLVGAFLVKHQIHNHLLGVGKKNNGSVGVNECLFRGKRSSTNKSIVLDRNAGVWVIRRDRVRAKGGNRLDGLIKKGTANAGVVVLRIARGVGKSQQGVVKAKGGVVIQVGKTVGLQGMTIKTNVALFK